MSKDNFNNAIEQIGRSLVSCTLCGQEYYIKENNKFTNKIHKCPVIKKERVENILIYIGIVVELFGLYLLNNFTSLH